MKNISGVGLVLTAAAVSVAGNDLENLLNIKGVFFCNVSAITGTTPTVQFIVEGKDTLSGAYYTILQSAALSTTGLVVLRVSEALVAVANLTASDSMPMTFRVRAVIAGTTPSVTATVGYNLMA